MLNNNNIIIIIIIIINNNNTFYKASLLQEAFECTFKLHIINLQ